MSKKYIVGVDFGHGETAAWVVPIVGTSGLGTDGESVRLKATNIVNERVMPSVVFYNQNGGYSLEMTMGSSIIGKMKSRVSDLRKKPKVMAAYQAYIKLVVEAIIKHNTILTLKDVDDDKPNFYICMASPTQWNDQDKNEYLQFFNDALADLGISFEWIINESDAAFFSHNKVVSQDDVALVIDFGSSTIDYTVMHKGKKVSNDDWSNAQLGAGNIEGAILESYRAKDYEGFQHSYHGTEELLESTGNSHIDINNVLDFECRRVKEESYTLAQNNTALDYHLGYYTGLNTQFRKFRFEYDFVMSEITSDYRKAVQRDIENLKAKIKSTTGKSVNKVILSGGACIMNWVAIMAMSIFPNAKIIDDRNPSYVVARGIALYARAQQNALNDLLVAVTSVDYKTTYRNADIQATKDAIRELSDPVVSKIRSTTTCIKMVDKFGEFIQGLDNSNPTYVNKIRSHVQTTVTDSVRNALRDAFVRHFKLEIDPSSININVQVECLPWDVTTFFYEVNGQNVNMEKTGMWSLTVMLAIQKILERNSTFFTGTNWTKDRNSSERNLIANSVVSEVLSNVSWLEDVDYGGENAFLIYQAESIKDQARQYAEDLFYQKQLFRTTFAK